MTDEDIAAFEEEHKLKVLKNIAAMLYSPQFQELLKHSSPKEIDTEIQNFL